MSESQGLRRAASMVAAFAWLGGCQGDDAAPPADAAPILDASVPSDAVEETRDATVADGADSPADDDADVAVCPPAPAERRACRPPLDTSLCIASWDDLPPLPCGLRVYAGPVGDYLAYYVSFADIPPLGGPSFLCIYDGATHALVGAYGVGDYLQYCCQSSLDIYEGNVTDEMINAAASMATHPPCEDEDAGDTGVGDTSGGS